MNISVVKIVISICIWEILYSSVVGFRFGRFILLRNTLGSAFRWRDFLYNGIFVLLPKIDKGSKLSVLNLASFANILVEDGLNNNRILALFLAIWYVTIIFIIIIQILLIFGETRFSLSLVPDILPIHWVLNRVKFNFTLSLSYFYFEDYL